MSISERPEGPADAVVTGSEEAWVSALGPDGAIGSLTVDGKRALAEALLDGLHRRRYEPRSGAGGVAGASTA